MDEDNERCARCDHTRFRHDTPHGGCNQITGQEDDGAVHHCTCASFARSFRGVPLTGSVQQIDVPLPSGFAPSHVYARVEPLEGGGAPPDIVEVKNHTPHAFTFTGGLIGTRPIPPGGTARARIDELGARVRAAAESVKGAAGQRDKYAAIRAAALLVAPYLATEAQRAAVRDAGDGDDEPSDDDGEEWEEDDDLSERQTEALERGANALERLADALESIQSMIRSSDKI